MEQKPEGADGRVEATVGPALWIVAGSSPEYGRTYLADYAGQTRRDVEQKVIDGARRERFTGTVDERLKMLGWEIVCVRLHEVPPNAQVNAPLAHGENHDD